MPLSTERRAQLDGIVVQMANKNAPKDDVNLIVNDFLGKYENEQAPSVEAPRQGLLSKAGGLVKDIFRPVARTAATSLSAMKAAAQLVTGDTAGAEATLDTGVTLPFYGKTAPLFTGRETTAEAAKIMLGTGAEIAPLLMTGGVGGVAKGGVAGDVLRPLLRGAFGKAAKVGAKEFGVPSAIGSFGLALGDQPADRGVREQLADVGTRTAVGGLIGTGLGVAAPVVSKGVGLALRPFKPEALMGKALGFTKTQIRNLDKIATQNKTYRGIKDFALKQGLEGSREDMAIQIGDRFIKATEAKPELLSNITQPIKNTFKGAFDYLRKTYATPGQEAALKEVELLAKKKFLTAVELDRTRYLIDKSLPSGAYRGAEPVRVEGIQNLVDPMRRALEKMDKTGTIKIVNQDIRILYDMVKAMEHAQSGSAGSQALWKTMQRMITFGGGATLAGTPIASIPFIVFGAAADFPQVSSWLAQRLRGIKVKMPQGIPDNIKKALREMFSEPVDDTGLLRLNVPKDKAGAVQLKTADAPILGDFLSKNIRGDKKVSGRTGVKPPTEAAGALAGLEPELDEDGNPTGGFKFNPEKAALGMGLMMGVTKGKDTKIGKSILGGFKNFSTAPKTGLLKLNIPRDAEVTSILRQSKGSSSTDIMAKHPDIQLKRDVHVTDIYGKKSVIPAGEALTPYELKGNKVLLQDGETYIVSKSQAQNVMQNAIKGEAKPFAPELEGLEETVKGSQRELLPLSKQSADELAMQDYVTPTQKKYLDDFQNRWDSTMEKNGDIQPLIKEYNTWIAKQPPVEQVPTKFSSYQLPDGKNYKEILIKAPQTRADFSNFRVTKMTYDDGTVRYFAEHPNGRSQALKTRAEAEKILEKNREIYGGIQKDNLSFKSSHWDEPNVIAHLRLNEHTYQGKKVTFVEELQSDWAREGRKKGIQQQPELPANLQRFKNGDVYSVKVPGEDFQFNGKSYAEAEKNFLDNAINNQKISGSIPNHPLLKKWQELSIKRGLKEAVDNKSEYFAWINGEQTSARYVLSTHLDGVNWKSFNDGERSINLAPKGQSKINLRIKPDGSISRMSETENVPSEWVGKKLDEVLGKGLADKIMEKESGKLSGEGLKFGGEWADNLYDKQVKNIVEDLTGGKVEVLDMKLPIDPKGKNYRLTTEATLDRSPQLTERNAKVGVEFSDRNEFKPYIITDVLGDGKFKAVPKSEMEVSGFKLMEDNEEGIIIDTRHYTSNEVKELLKKPQYRGYRFEPWRSSDYAETFDISLKMSAGQQAIKITPEIRAKILGEVPVLKAPSGRLPLLSKVTPKIGVGIRVMLSKAPEAKKYIDTEAQRISSSIPNTKVAEAPIKGYDRAAEKTMEDYKGDFTRLKDLARNTIIVQDDAARVATINAMRARKDIFGEKIQEPAKFFGYEGMIFNIRTPKGLVSETQVVSPKMTFGKNSEKFARKVLGNDVVDRIAKETRLKPGHGHILYEQMRVLDETNPAHQDALRRLRQESIDFYAKLR